MGTGMIRVIVINPSFLLSMWVAVFKSEGGMSGHLSTLQLPLWVNNRWHHRVFEWRSSSHTEDALFAPLVYMPCSVSCNTLHSPPISGSPAWQDVACGDRTATPPAAGHVPCFCSSVTSQGSCIPSISHLKSSTSILPNYIALSISITCQLPF